jgi:hypothetical protein
LAHCAVDCHSTTSLTTALQQKHRHEKCIVRKLTVNVLLMLTVLVRKACISSLSSKISSCQGVLFRSISLRGNLGLEEEDSGTCAPDVPGPLGAYSICGWSLTRSSAPPGLQLMGSTSIIFGEAGTLTSPTAPPSPTATVHGGLATLASTTGGEHAVLSVAPRGRVAVRASLVNASATTLGSGDLVREGEA